MSSAYNLEEWRLKYHQKVIAYFLPISEFEEGVRIILH